MLLICTDASRRDLRALDDCTMDMEFGDGGGDANTFELRMPVASAPEGLTFGSLVYVDGTEYGGIVDDVGSDTTGRIHKAVYGGRTWHGVLEGRVLRPDRGADYLSVSGEANAVLLQLVHRMGLAGLFAVDASDSGIRVGYRFARYVAGYAGLRAMLASAGAKLAMRWDGGKVVLSAMPRRDWSREEFEGRRTPIKIKQASEAGAKVINLCSGENSLSFLKEIAKAITDSGRAKKVAGYDEFTASLADVKVSDRAKEIADAYLGAKKAMIVYQQNFLTVAGAELVADIAMISGHIGTPRDGILAIRPKNNSQGLIDMGITAGAEALEGVKALIVFGENAPIDTDALEFLAVCDTHMTELASKADLVIPGTGFASTNGTFTNTERRLQLVEAAIDEDVLFANWEVAAEIAHVFEVDFDWADTDDISDEMADTVPAYKYAQLDEVLGGVLAPTEDARLVVVEDGPVVDELPVTDSLMQVIKERLPEPADPTA